MAHVMSAPQRDRLLIASCLPVALLLSQAFWRRAFGDGFVPPAWDYAVIAYGAYFMRTRMPSWIFLLAGLSKDVYVGFPVGTCGLCYFSLHVMLAQLGKESTPRRYVGWHRHIAAGLVCACLAETLTLWIALGKTSLYDFFFYAIGTCLCYVPVHVLLQGRAAEMVEKAEGEEDKRFSGDGVD
ncbi:MAG: hypothetical protein ABW189_05390 [Rickettsiales bacterium]